MTIDPIGPVPAAGVYRVSRGGSWVSLARGARAADRNDGTPDRRYLIIGFRLTVTLPCNASTRVVQ